MAAKVYVFHNASDFLPRVPRAIERLGQHLGDLGLANPRLPFEKERTLHAKGEEKHGRQRPSNEIIMLRQEIDDGIDRSRQASF